MLLDPAPGIFGILARASKLAHVRRVALGLHACAIIASGAGPVSRVVSVGIMNSLSSLDAEAHG
jgi:hypothetical protein